jgi:hypothetical protein
MKVWRKRRAATAAHAKVSGASWLLVPSATEVSMPSRGGCSCFWLQRWLGSEGFVRLNSAASCWRLQIMVEHIVCNTKRWCLDPEVRRRASSGGFAPQRSLSHFWEMEAQGISCFFLKKQKLRRLTKFFAISWKLRLCTWMKAQLFFVLWKKAPYLNESLAIFRRTKVSYSDENSAIFVFSLGNEFFLHERNALVLENPIFRRHSPSYGKVKS